jgi:SAM-dependent methyltransferase
MRSVIPQGRDEMGLVSSARTLARTMITGALERKSSRAMLVKLLASGCIRRTPAFLSQPLFLHVAEYSRRHPEFFSEMETQFKSHSEDEFQAAFWGSDFGYWIMVESDTRFSTKEFFAYFRQAAEELACSSFLDVGCGYGCLCRWFTTKFPQARVAGLDISPNVLKAAQTRTHRAGLEVEFVQGAGTALLERFAPRSFDTVACTDSFQYMESGLEVLRQMSVVASRSLFVIAPRGALSVEEYRDLEQPFRMHDYDRHWVHPLVAYARALNLPVYREGPTSANCYFMDVRF